MFALNESTLGWTPEWWRAASTEPSLATVQPRAIPEPLHGIVPALVASLVRRPGLPVGTLASAVVQFQPILSQIAEHQRRQRPLQDPLSYATASDYEAEYMVGATLRGAAKGHACTWLEL